jgi:hypothetical protein
MIGRDLFAKVGTDAAWISLRKASDQHYQNRGPQFDATEFTRENAPGQLRWGGKDYAGL